MIKEHSLSFDENTGLHDDAAVQHVVAIVG